MGVWGVGVSQLIFILGLLNTIKSIRWFRGPSGDIIQILECLVTPNHTLLKSLALYLLPLDVYLHVNQHDPSITLECIDNERIL